MGRHAEHSGILFDLRRSAQLAGLTGGAAWVVTLFLSGGGVVETAVLWVGAVLITAALVGLGLLLVRSDLLALRVFVAVALPTLVWGVFGIVHGSAADPGVVDAVFGAVVALVCAVRLGQHSTEASRATL
jgi:hypothetical protein